MLSFIHHGVLLTLASGALLASGSVSAASRPRSFVQNATGACQPTLPVFDGQIRKRPLALQNEGTAPAFVSCSFMGTDTGVGGSRSIRSVLLYADNNTGSAVDLTCTLIDGYSGVTTTYFPKSKNLPANSKSNLFEWTSQADNGGIRFFYTVSASCNLPVGVGLSVSFTYYDEDPNI